MSDSQVLFITGANTGLGLEIVKALCQSSTKYTIILGCRTRAKAQEAIDTVKSEYPKTSSSFDIVEGQLDDDATLKASIDYISKKYDRLDILINNGGASFGQLVDSGELTLREAFNKSWDVNVTGTHILTTFAVPLLLKSKNPRLIFLTSATSALADTERMEDAKWQRLNASPDAGWPKPKQMVDIIPYRSAKTGLNMLMREWAKMLKKDGVKVWCLSPGFLATGLADVGKEKLKQMGALDPAIGADLAVSIVEGKHDDKVGKVVSQEGVQNW